VLLGAQGERVHVDTRRRRASVVLEGLHLVEVRALALSETVLAVELELGDFNGILALATNAGVKDDLGEQVVDTRLELTRASYVNIISTNLSGRLRGTLSKHSRRLGGLETLARASSLLGLGKQRHDEAVRAEVIGVVERLGAADRRNPGGRRAVNERVTLDHPLELLYGVIEVQLDLVRAGRDALSASVLHLLDEVLVALLSETAALFRVEVHVVNIQRGGGERLGGRLERHTNTLLRILAVLPCIEVHIDAHLVVLERNQGNR